MMIKTNYILILLGLTLFFFTLSCKKESNPKAVIRVVETIDDVLVPVYNAFVEIGPATQENILDDVVAEGYTDLGGYIDFEFDKELVLRAIASELKKGEHGELILDDEGNPIPIKSGYKTIVLKVDLVDNKTIEIKEVTE